MKKLTLTLDWNCVIEVDEDRAQACAVIELVRRHRRGEVDVALLAASASENNKDKEFASTSHMFERRIQELGWGDLPLVPVPQIIGLTYLGAYAIGDADEFKRDTDALWAAMFPKFASDPGAHLAEGERLTDTEIQGQRLFKWRNRWCDVISAYSHIQARRDIFVTANTVDFQRHAKELATLGMKLIETPESALTFLVTIPRC